MPAGKRDNAREYPRSRETVGMGARRRVTLELSQGWRLVDNRVHRLSYDENLATVSA